MPVQVCVIGLYSVNLINLHWFTFTHSTLETLTKAFEEQSAAMKDLQAQIKMIAERQNANLKCPDAQMEEVADGASGDWLRQQKLDRPVQQEVHLSSSGNI